MLKAFYFIWRKPDMSRDAFIEYYEYTHAPLINANLPPPKDFRRNYPVWQGVLGSRRPFDVVTAITHASEPAFREAMGVYLGEPFHEVVTEDERQFMNREVIRFVPVDEVLHGRKAEEWSAAPVTAAKLIRFVRRAEGLGPAEFRQAYESEMVPQIERIVGACADYRRNYLRHGDAFSYMTPTLQESMTGFGPVDCDLIEEFSFHDQEAADAARRELDLLSSPAWLTAHANSPAMGVDLGTHQLVV